ncbi:undecaprenyl/decaprenyl-phosphate alpha-N-acetylglucosaminyl 1-phosphate transferase [Phragmitibacter flavus]|uniref:Undecaprenyl/decaprenyl-phosphate alpha-N-acetylglucosaminyl 1-phosphate transferase n=1 Tax=Phragmitibacter flavus TaxID=2576071 RepID=A0A5R8KC92_9BACT|nr:MraY family glycosyltransferase [Phragmitibacter flavus]TLD69934.1 undecaprenyl/decaprenyl-phosphate alpha-N-acetylglucosaminyl 1-phosphate transferase [Phragmitibacter flavus]
MWQLDTISLLFVGALILSAATTWLLLRNGGKFGMDKPDSYRKQHEKPISRLGGLPIVLALAAGFVVLAYRQPEFAHKWLPIIATNVLIFIVGFLDDLHPLGARIKLVGQIGVAMVLYSLGISIDMLSNPLGAGNFSLGWWSLPLTVIWLVSIPNIINLIDGMDGLATGFGMFLCVTLAFIGHFANMADVVLMSTVMAGALAGFLIFNFPPARIFLGDGGAYLIGFFVASVSLVSSNKGAVMAGLLVMLIALGVPILDTLFAIIRRAVRGVPIFRADAEHIHHRLMVLGFSKAKALVALYSVCLVLSLMGISVLWSRGISLPIVGAVVFLLALSAARYLGYVRSWRTLKAQFQEAMVRRQQMLFTNAYTRVLEWEIERCKSGDEFETLLMHTIDRVGLSPDPRPGFKPSVLTLSNDRMVTLYFPGPEDAEPLWRARTDLFTIVLSLAQEKWGESCTSRLHAIPTEAAIQPINALH